jgi:hypothetical protein
VSQTITNLQHEDGRWVRLVLQHQRVDRMQGTRGVGEVTVYRSYDSIDAAARANVRERDELVAAGYRVVEAIEGFKRPRRLRDGEMVDRERSTEPLLPGPPGSPFEAMAVQLDAQTGVTVVLKRFPPASDAELDAAEHTLGRALPPPLRAFLARTNGAYVHWEALEHGWNVYFDVVPVQRMLALWEECRELGLLPISERYGRDVLGVDDEGRVVLLLDPPDGDRRVLAADFDTFLSSTIASYFVITGASDVSEKQLPAMRERFQ